MNEFSPPVWWPSEILIVPECKAGNNAEQTMFQKAMLFKRSRHDAGAQVCVCVGGGVQVLGRRCAAAPCCTLSAAPSGGGGGLGGGYLAWSGHVSVHNPSHCDSKQGYLSTNCLPIINMKEHRSQVEQGHGNTRSESDQ